MAVPIEAISVVIRANRLLAAFGDDWDAFRRTVPNQTLCADGELVRVGFMTPSEGYAKLLESHGLRYLRDGGGEDIVVVDQLRGPVVACDWIEWGHVDLNNNPRQRVASCRLRGSTLQQILRPEGWTFEKSLSCTYGFVPTESRTRA